MSNLVNIGHGMTLGFTKNNETGSRDAWLYFKSEDGKSASLSIAALAESRAGIVGMALKEWARDRINERMAELIAEEEEE